MPKTIPIDINTIIDGGSSSLVNDNPTDNNANAANTTPNTNIFPPIPVFHFYSEHQ